MISLKDMTTPDENLIGVIVVKKSRKPFKSGEKMGTIKGYVIHPYTKRLAFIFQEDDSFVECKQCTVLQ